jgi:3-oxoacyl-[acyl-carrier protein] reductase
LENLTQGLAAELGPPQNRVNAIAPGYTRSECTETAGLLSEESVKRYVSVTPLGRLGDPKDIGAVAVFLASDASHWVTGETIRPEAELDKRERVPVSKESDRFDSGRNNEGDECRGLE